MQVLAIKAAQLFILILRHRGKIGTLWMTGNPNRDPSTGMSTDVGDPITGQQLIEELATFKPLDNVEGSLLGNLEQHFAAKLQAHGAFELSERHLFNEEAHPYKTWLDEHGLSTGLSLVRMRISIDLGKNAIHFDIGYARPSYRVT